jgi:hypothetical protein
VHAYYKTLELTAANPEDSASFARLVHPQCPCRAVVRLLERLAQTKHRLLFSVTTSRARVARADQARATVVVRVQQAAGREVDATGHQVRAVAPSSGTYAVELAAVESQWVVRRITRTSR